MGHPFYIQPAFHKPDIWLSLGRDFVLPTLKWLMIIFSKRIFYQTADDTLEVLNIVFCFDIIFLSINSLVQLRSSLN